MDARVKEILSWYDSDNPGRNPFQRAKPRALEFLSTVMKIYSGELK